jgi:glycosyltransferase involved in cell wall biosynthesis
VGKTRLFVEAVPLVDKQISGIPHVLAGLIGALAANKTIQREFEIVLVAPANRMHLLDRWAGLEHCTRKAIPMKFRIMNGLGRRGLLPPMDLLLGKGVYLFGNFFNWPLTKRSRSLTYIHDICFAVHPEYVQPDNQRSLAKNVPRYIAQTDYVITVSEHAKQEIHRIFMLAMDKLVVLYNGVDLEQFRQYSADESKAVARKYGVEGDYLLFVGNIEPRKNLERMLEAMKQVSKDIALIMVGSDGWLNERVFGLIDALNAAGHTIVKPKTYVSDEDVARLMSGAKALLLPSLYEGFGMPALEAMAAKALVVVGDIPPLHEVASEAGIFCDPMNVDSIAQAINKALSLSSDEKAKRIKEGSARAAAFTWQHSAETLVEILQTAARDVKNG